MSRALACACAIGLVSFCAGQLQARPADFSVSLEYTAVAGCPDAAALEAVVSARLGYDPFADAAPDHVAVRIAPRGASFEGQIEWRDVSGKWVGDQAFRAGSGECRGLMRTIGLALAVQIQLLADTRGAARPDAAGTPEPTPAQREANESPNTPGVTPATPPTRPAPSPAPSNRAEEPNSHAQPPGAEHGARPTFALGAGTSVALGLSSNPVLLGRAFGSIAGPHLSLELGAELSLPSTTRRADGAGFSQQLLLGTAAGCAALSRWSLCVIANAGEVKMTPKDVDRPKSATTPIFDTGLRLNFTEPLTRRFFVRARAETLIHVARWEGTIDGEPVWKAPLFAAAIGVDAGINIF